MAKLIKKGTGEVHDTAHEQEISEFTQISESRRAPIIDRDTFEARAAAQQIRERAQIQADEIVVEATAKANAMLDQAAIDAQELKANAESEGYREGKEAGVNELVETVAQVSLRAQTFESELVPQLSTLAIAIAKKILGKELEFHPEAVVQIVKQALGEKARQRREISLCLHPDDLQMIREHKAELLEMLSRTKEIAFREDANVARYGVIIETEAGTIDAQLDTQLAIFEQVLQHVG